MEPTGYFIFYKSALPPGKRNAYTAMWFEALELFNAGEIIGIKNDSYLKWYEMMRGIS